MPLASYLFSARVSQWSGSPAQWAQPLLAVLTPVGRLPIIVPQMSAFDPLQTFSLSLTTDVAAMREVKLRIVKVVLHCVWDPSAFAGLGKPSTNATPMPNLYLSCSNLVRQQMNSCPYLSVDTERMDLQEHQADPARWPRRFGGGIGR